MENCLLTKLKGSVSMENARALGDLCFTIEPQGQNGEICVKPNTGKTIHVSADKNVYFYVGQQNEQYVKELDISGWCYIKITEKVTFTINAKYDLSVCDFNGYNYGSPVIFSQCDSLDYTPITRFVAKNSAATEQAKVVDTDTISSSLSEIVITNNKKVFGGFKKADLSSMTKFEGNNSGLDSIDLSECESLTNVNLSYSSTKFDVANLPSSVTTLYINDAPNAYGNIATLKSDSITNINISGSNGIIGELNELAAARKQREHYSNFTVVVNDVVTLNGETKALHPGKTKVVFTYVDNDFVGSWED